MNRDRVAGLKDTLLVSFLQNTVANTLNDLSSGISTPRIDAAQMIKTLFIDYLQDVIFSFKKKVRSVSSTLFNRSVTDWLGASKFSSNKCDALCKTKLIKAGALQVPSQLESRFHP